MATRLKSNSFQRNLLFSIGGIFILFSICFGVYQYNREKEYKIDILHSRLQMYNYEMIQMLGADSVLNKKSFQNYILTHNMIGLRVTIIDKNGTVIQDSKEDNVDSLDNHLHRLEVQKALRDGNGYDIKRTSESTHETYFYSATRFGNMVVRSAVPYNAEVTKSLQADNSYMLFGIFITFLLGITLFFITRRIGRHIDYLREFAYKAEEGQDFNYDFKYKLPKDELGDISHTIIALYWKLRHSEEDKIRMKRQLTQNAAHELKTPIASIHGFLESIIENPNMPSDKRQHFIERCYAQSERMSNLLHDMDILTKLDDTEYVTKALRTNDNIVDVRVIIKNVIEDSALQLQNKGIIPQISLPERILVRGDNSLIYSVFRNLVDNTIAYSNATHLNITCSEKEENKGNRIVGFFEFVVSDNGVGVEAQQMPHLFERFYRVDKGRSRKLGGTGLGLAIVKNAIVVHGGNVVAEPTQGGGLTIRFTLAR